MHRVLFVQLNDDNSGAILVVHGHALMREIIVYVRARVSDKLELVAECQDGVVKVFFIYCFSF